MSKLILNLLFSFITLTPFSFAEASGNSAFRRPQESYEEARTRHFKQFVSLEGFSHGRPGSPESNKKPLRKLNILEVPEVPSMEELTNVFYFLRDTRFMEDPTSNTLRRPSWLYPDDGCYARAEVAKIELDSHHLLPPKKLFVFGALSVKTTNSPDGEVHWWYHVALTYRLNNVLYVLDPAIEPKRPLTIVEWNQLIGGQRNQVQYSICAKDTFGPTNFCDGTETISAEEAIAEQSSFFRNEWTRLLRLKRNPKAELGDNPPWLKNIFLD